MMAASALDLIFIYCYLVWRNKKKRSSREASEYGSVENKEFMDLTDWENPDFVYAL